MYGNNNYLMHYGTPNMRWYHVGEGKRQENPNKYAHKDQTIGFDDSKWKNSRAYQKLHGIKESLYLKADEAQAKADEAKKSRDDIAVDNKFAKEDIAYGKDHKPFLWNKNDWAKFLVSAEERLSDNKKKEAEYNKEYKKNKRSASWNRTLGRLMNIPLAVAFIGYSAGSNLASAIKGIGRTIGSIKLGKNTIGDYAKKFTGLFGKKSSGTASDKNSYSLNDSNNTNTNTNTNTNSANNSGDSIGLKQRVKYARMSPLELFYSILNGK